MRAPTRTTVITTLAAVAVAGLYAIAPPSAADRLFTATDPFNRGVAANNPTPYPNSAALAARLGTAAYDAHLNYGDQGPAFYQATPNTPTFSVTPRQSGWGNPFSGYRMPWDASWGVPRFVDGWTAVTTADRSYTFECWETRVNNGTPSCQYGAISHPDAASTAEGGATGSGLSITAGPITAADWNAREITHALSFGTPDNDNGMVYPATKTDGGTSGSGFAEGDYMWASKTGDCANPAGLSEAQAIVWRALQDYGAFNVDNAATFGFSSEMHAQVPGVSGSGGYTSMRALPFASCVHVGTVDAAPGTPTVSPTPTTGSPTPTTASPTPTRTSPSPTPTVSPTNPPAAKLSAANVCRASRYDKRNWWAIANIGQTATPYTTYVMYAGQRTNGPAGTLQPGQVKSIRTANGGTLHATYNGTEATATSNHLITCT